MIDSNSYKIKKALVSVSDKTGIVEFCKELENLNIEIFSTGGTASLLNNNNIKVRAVDELIDFPEILDGRVKTLHPVIHAGLLADLGKENHKKQITDLHIESIDLLIVNLYPFEESLKKPTISHEELIENIDIGGPAMLRSASKNYKWTAPVINSERYTEIIDILKNNSCTIPESYRIQLAGEVFSYTSYYDALIAEYFNNYNKIEFPKKFAIPAKQEYTLRYGENPHQKAALLGNFSSLFEKIHGKELSFNNIIDINAASNLIFEFDEPAVAIIKHTNPCGAATGIDLVSAWEKAFSTDNVSPFGGITVVNKIIDKSTAEAINNIFLEVIIAPEYTSEALEILIKKKDRRLIRVDFEKLKKSIVYDLRSVAGGFLIQTADRNLIDEQTVKIVTERKPSDDEMKALMFAWKIAKHVKSNAIVYTSNDRTLAIGAGQMSRLDSSRIAVEKAKTMGIDLKNSVVASDAFFPFADGLLQAIEAGATAVIQPGGSVRDNDVIKAANDHNISMVFTNMRHFRH